MTTEKGQSTGTNGSKGRRSPNYPAISFPSALELAKKIYDREGRADVSPDIAMKHGGYSSMNGRALRVLSALKSYGLFSEQNGQIRISDQGRLVMVHPEGSPERQATLRELAMRPSIFQNLLARFGEDIPSDDNFRAKLITEFDFMDDAATICLRSFKDSLQYIKSMGLEPVVLPAASSSSAGPVEPVRSVSPTIALAPVDEPKSSPKWRTVFPVGKNVTVEITASAPLRAKQYDLLIKHVELLKEAAAADEAEHEEHPD